ncbi:MAG: nuclear transport factor 2 family protein [Saprospiraceae bacterium]|nr:nuclear transport factor 2 family protein [Saprospiraceae bacterium]
MTTEEVAKRLVEYCRKGQWFEAQEALYDENCESIEPPGTQWGSVKGMDAIREKGKKWGAMVEEVHGSEISDPIVAENYIAMSMVSDTTFKGMGRMKFEELGVYEVKNGKVTKEQFFYTPPPQQ